MRIRFLIVSAMLCVQVAHAQKKPLDHSVYDSWQSINSTAISKNGSHLFYLVGVQEGDAKLYIKDQKNQLLGTIDRASAPRFSNDEQYIITTIKPFYQETREARIKKKKPDEMPKDTLAIFALKTKEIQKIPAIKSFKTPTETGNYLAYVVEEKPATLPASEDSTQTRLSAKPKRPTDQLVIHHYQTGRDTAFDRVSNYFFNDKGTALIMTRTAQEKDSTGLTAGVYWYDLANKTLYTVTQGKGDYKGINIHPNGQQIVFLGDKVDRKNNPKIYSIYQYSVGQDSAQLLAHQQSNGLPNGYQISGDATLLYSDDGKKLYFGVAPIAVQKDTTLVDFEHAKVDIWHWKDEYLQTQQLVNLRRDLTRSFQSVINLDNPTRILVLANENLPDIRFAEGNNQEWALGITDKSSRIASQWLGGTIMEVHLVSTITGEHKKVIDQLRGNISFSPTGKYLVWFDRQEGEWYRMDIQSQEKLALKTNTGIRFANEDNDVPDDPGSYGVMGYTQNDESILLYDKYDIWNIHLKDGQAQCITQGFGRQNNLTFRNQILLRPETSSSFRRSTPIDLKKPLLMTAFNNATKLHGYYRLSSGKKLESILEAPYRYAQFKNSESGEWYLYTKENYQSSPDLFLSKAFKNEIKLSATNPQQAEYNWGTAELVEWTTPKGFKAQGILYKPEDFDPTKKYPMISYFYELVSDELYSYVAPTPTPSRLNISFFVSNGYLVFTPDIRYEIGYPGKSAEEYINSGVEHLKQNAWVDGSKIGIQGQSWGGYQVAHLITRTNMYAAAWSGAPVVNMTSAYGGIRWQTGLNRQFQYERTQSRIGATLWEKPDLYIENSPLFFMPQVNTPVVIMHNDEDGAVPWYQGIEMFTALRRLEKPVWMLNYNGDGHNLVQRQNRKDIQRRQLQFFDHYLKGKPAAPWLSEGVPATKKGIDWGF
jgi:dipeptidyl aminopeptidase/acylaminoacyl peptidase